MNTIICFCSNLFTDQNHRRQSIRNTKNRNTVAKENEGHVRVHDHVRDHATTTIESINAINEVIRNRKIKNIVMPTINFFFFVKFSCDLYRYFLIKFHRYGRNRFLMHYLFIKKKHNLASNGRHFFPCIMHYFGQLHEWKYFCLANFGF